MNSELKELYDIFQRSPHGRWIVDFGDYEKLHDLIQSRKPKQILEIGTGIGAATALLAKYSDAQIDTVEQFEKCITIAKDLIPLELQSRINFYQSPCEVFQMEGIPFVFLQRHLTLPVGDYDLVVIDGPGPYKDETGYLVDLPGGDFISFIYTTKPGTIFYVDGRKAMVSLMDRFFSRYLALVDNQAKHALFMRTSAEVPEDRDKLELIDKREDWLRKRGYFDAV